MGYLKGVRSTSISVRGDRDTLDFCIKLHQNKKQKTKRSFEISTTKSKG